ncbi:MAG: cadherin-like beta sandwich domain-containing protein [Lachnospiraceae bacterium]|nr:cadherin-like beta sandwich domain-containing protein [Lachnospiraceae bacterium]
MRKNSRLVRFFSFIFALIFTISAETCFFEGFTPTAYAATSGKVTATLLNVRTGAGTKYSILRSGSTLVRLPKNTTVTINSEKSGWYYISFSYNGKNLKGYASKSYITKTTAKTTSTTTSLAGTKGYVTASSLNVRTGASTSSAIMKYNSAYVRLKKGVVVDIISKTNSWYYASFNYSGTVLKGYLSSSYVSLTKPNTATPTPAPTVKPTVAPTVKPTVTPTLAPTPVPVVVPELNGDIMGETTADALNVRTGEGTTYAILKQGATLVKLVKGTKVVIKGSNGGWYNIKFVFNNEILEGYATSEYIKITKGALPTIAPTPTPASAPAPVINPVVVEVTKAPVEDITAATEAPKETKVDGDSANSLGKVIADTSLNVRTGAGTSFDILSYNNQYIRLAYGTSVKIEKEENGWMYISFNYDDKVLQGYVSATYVEKVTDEKVAEVATNIPENKASQEPEVNNEILGNVTATVLNVRTGAGTSYEMLKYDDQYVRLSTGATVRIVEKLSGWYKVEFSYNNKTLTGYVCADYVKIAENVEKDEAFEAKLNEQGFPESYKVLLRQLHKSHPNWEFRAFNTGLDWDTVIAKEGAVGINLIPNSKNIAWKSLDKGAYSYATDTFVPYDGSSWVTASKPVVAYYMDPRNFLYDSTIFEFELLSYHEGYQTKSGVEAILKNTAMFNKEVPVVDINTNTQTTMLYSDIFMAAAKYSGVSPYHLASRVKQEVVTSKTTLSNSVSGTVEGFEGYYNYYNIGAYNSTVSLGAIKNGLNYAKNGTSSASTNASYLIPWTDPYRAIVGGAKFISASYIGRGQNTIYLEKFNVTNRSTYNHQYMSNVQAAWSESVKVAEAYRQIDNYDELPIVFSIPVYKNMPQSACSLPADAKNPNNWLKSLSVTDYALSPAFDVNKNQEYSIVVGSDVTSINIAATAVSSYAKVSGTGAVSIAPGNNKIEVSVTAQNGDVRKYVINVIR